MAKNSNAEAVENKVYAAAWTRPPNASRFAIGCRAYWLQGVTVASATCYGGQAQSSAVYPIRDLPICDLPNRDQPICDLPIRDLTICDLPIRDLPIRDLPIATYPFAMYPFAIYLFAIYPLKQARRAYRLWLALSHCCRMRPTTI